MAYRLTKYEQETIINFNEEEDTATVYTCNKTLSNRLLKLAKISDCVTVNDKTSQYAIFTIPKKLVKISTPRAKRKAAIKND